MIKGGEQQKAVFFPYKAFSWDSLESVWRAARVDENCGTYVIPIPYYDKNPDGSLGEMYYEGDLYSEDVQHQCSHGSRHCYSSREPT